MRIVVLGAGGQLGKTFLDMSKTYDHIWQFFSRKELDITDPQDINEVMAICKPDIVINTAAYTAVDRAESEQEKAAQVNTDGVRLLAEYCKKASALLMHYSTDYVYHIDSEQPLEETDTLAPQSVYAKTKAAGENVIQDIGCRAIIMRTSWVYSEYGNNFVKTMLRLAAEHPSLRIVNDQIGAPTYTRDIVRATMHLIAVQDAAQSSLVNTVNYSNQGQISWYDFAQEIFRIKGIDIEVTPIPTEDYPTPAPRPKWSVMNLEKIQCHGVKIKGWKESLAECLMYL